MPDNRPSADGNRVLADLNALRAIGAYKTGVHKPTFSEPHKRSLDWLLQNLPEAGLTARIDDRKSTRLNSSHVSISYAVCCLKKKTEAGHSALLYSFQTFMSREQV